MSSLDNDHLIPLNSSIFPSSTHIFNLSQQPLLFTSLGHFVALAAFSGRLSPFRMISLLLANLVLSPGNSSIAMSSMMIIIFFAFPQTFLLPSPETVFYPPADLTSFLLHDNCVFHDLLLHCRLVLTPCLHRQESQGWLLLSSSLGFLLFPLQCVQNLLEWMSMMTIE